MSDLIAVRCHECHVGMKIKPEYIGKLRKCPKCGTIFLVPKQDGDTLMPPENILEQIRHQETAKQAQAKSTQSTQQEVTQQEDTYSLAVSGTTTQTYENALSFQASMNTPTETIDAVEFQSEGIIHPVEHPKRLDAQNRYIILSDDRLVGYWQMSTGWQVFDGTKLVSARRNTESIPKQGDFRFIELQLGEQDKAFRILHLRIFKLARQYSVTKIALEENDVLTTIIGTAGLTRSQKNILLQSLKAHFMRSMWADSPVIYDYLFNDDFHSSEI